MSTIEKMTRKIFRNLHYLLFKTIFPLGHYYSPIVSRRDIQKREEKIFAAPARELHGIDLNEAGQMELLDQMVPFYSGIPWGPEPKPPLRYYFNNICYSYSDAVFLYSVMRFFRPRRIIEVGSGFSSAAMLDTSQLFMNNEVIFRFIDPEPGRLESLLNAGDRRIHQIIPQCVQDTDINIFAELSANDILFIDSSHVCKTGSDVHYIFFEVFPCLKPGVLIHIHDIFYPFEYPKAWAYDGHSWNEDYFLRAFLTHNSSYRIILMNTFLQTFHREWFESRMPLCLKDTGGSIWIKKF